MIQIYVIRIGMVEIHRNQVIGEELYQHPLDYLSNWLSESQFEIPHTGITIVYLSDRHVKYRTYKVYDHLQISLPIQGSQSSYREVQDLWFMKPDDYEFARWYIQYEDEMVYALVNSDIDHCGCTTEGHMLMSREASKHLEQFLKVFHGDRVKDANNLFHGNHEEAFDFFTTQSIQNTIAILNDLSVTDWKSLTEEKKVEARKAIDKLSKIF